MGWQITPSSSPGPGRGPRRRQRRADQSCRRQRTRRCARVQGFTDRRRIERERSPMIADLQAAVHARGRVSVNRPQRAAQPGECRAAAVDRHSASVQRGSSGTDEMGRRVYETCGAGKRSSRPADSPPRQLLDVFAHQGGQSRSSSRCGFERRRRKRHQPVCGRSAHGQMTLKAHHAVVGHWDRLRLEQVVSNVLSNAINTAKAADSHLARGALIALRGYRCKSRDRYRA